MMGRDGMGWGGVLDGMGWDGMDPEGMGQGTTSMDGSHRIGSGIGLDRVGSDRVESARMGSDRIGSDLTAPHHIAPQSALHRSHSASHHIASDHITTQACRKQAARQDASGQVGRQANDRRTDGQASIQAGGRTGEKVGSWRSRSTVKSAALQRDYIATER